VFVLNIDMTITMLNQDTGDVIKRVPISSAVPGAATRYGYSETSAPICANHRVITGAAGSEYGVRGFVMAFRTSDLSPAWANPVWSIPPSGTEWRKVSRIVGGGVTWTPVTIDTSTNTVYYGTGSATPLYFPAWRPGSAPRTDSLVAVDLKTGKLKWWQQQMAHNEWSYDTAQPPLVYDGKVGRKKRRDVSVATMEGVWFAYDAPHLARGEVVRAEPEWVLKGVSFTAGAGQTTALVGHTGAGKTTIVNLLMRFYDPQRGRILVNGHDIRSLSTNQLRSLIAYVQQDIFLFAGDIASNIRLANPLDDSAVERAAKRVGADRIIRRLPAGYGHLLGERGTSISVGERQLLSFARAIAADAPVLLLDEATSAVDSEIEAEIQRALEVLLANRTTIAVAHRLSTIARADLILVLHHGEIVQRGTHRELLAAGGLYEKLWRLQAGEAREILPRAG